LKEPHAEPLAGAIVLRDERAAELRRGFREVVFATAANVAVCDAEISQRGVLCDYVDLGAERAAFG